MYLRYYLILIIFSVLLLSGCSTSSDINTKWVGSWSTAQQLTEPRNNPPEPGLNGNTIRQIVHVSVGGEELRFRISNKFGAEPVEITEIHVAKSLEGSSIDSATNTALTFSGESAITLQPGEAALSDPFSFDLEKLSNVAITMHIESIGQEITGHPGSRTTSYILEGNHVTAAEFSDPVTTDHWYLIDAIDVKAPEHFTSVVTLGNSITDGRGSGTNKQNRWPDELSRRLQANQETQDVAVLNAGIGGNCVLRDCLGPAAVDRFERDVLNQTGVKWLIILEGINDIGGVRSDEQADELVQDLAAAYEQMIQKAHAQDIKVYGATMLPFGGSFYDRPASERARKGINEWIRNSGKFDAVIDLDKALEDPENPGQLLPVADDGDGLHPSERGHQLIAEAINLSLFEEPAE
ncbi:MAG TPA: GDSL family lipase [Balneolaceae bacterium]|nr:GDSL family lipase [Balneolaceae bacterium]